MADGEGSVSQKKKKEKRRGGDYLVYPIKNANVEKAENVFDEKMYPSKGQRQESKKNFVPFRESPSYEAHLETYVRDDEQLGFVSE